MDGTSLTQRIFDGAPYAIAALALLVLALRAAKARDRARGVFRYYALHSNTAVLWLAAATAFYAAARWLGSWALGVPLLLAAFLVHEVIYVMLRRPTHVFDEDERVDAIYRWGDVYLSQRGKTGTDTTLTEGYFGGDYTLTAEEACQRRWDEFYRMLALRPGSRVLDVGCGYGQWLEYLRGRGVEATGLVLSSAHYEACKARGLDVILGDGRRPPRELDGRFDAVTYIGCVEHFAKKTMAPEEKAALYRTVMRRSAEMLRAGGGRVLFSTLHFAQREYLPTLDTWGKQASAFFHDYLLERHYSGNYPQDDQLVTAASGALTLVDRRDTTEDYRYLSIINPDHFGMWSIAWDLPRAAFAVRLALTDPFWIHKWLYHAFGVWMWQFGGTAREPITDGRVRPVKLLWLLFEGPATRDVVSQETGDSTAMA